MHPARLARGLFLGLLLAGFTLAWARAGLPHPPLGNCSWPEGLLLLLAAAGTLAAHAREAPGQNVVLASVIILSLAGLVLVVGARVGLPLGPITGPARSASDLLAWLPWAAVLWFLALLSSRGVARLILRSRRACFTYGFQVIGLTILLFLLFNLASRALTLRLDHAWLWQGGHAQSNRRGMPWMSLAIQAVAALVILALATPSLIDKKPSVRPPGRFPLMVWALANLLFATAAVS
jgi:hypothetical protein